MHRLSLSRLLLPLGLLSGALFPSLAQAGYVTLHFNGVSPSKNISYVMKGGGNSTSAGAFNWTSLKPAKLPADSDFYNTYPVGSTNIDTFCVELDQYISPGSKYTYSVVPLEQVPSPGKLAGGAMKAQKADYLRELFGRFYNATISQDATKAAAFQMCVWEIVDDTTYGKWKVVPGAGQGDYYVTSGNGARTQAQLWLDALNLNGKADPGEFNNNPFLEGKHLVGLSSPTAQDQIALCAVPAPPGFVLASIGSLSLIMGTWFRRFRFFSFYLR